MKIKLTLLFFLILPGVSISQFRTSVDIVGGYDYAYKIIDNTNSFTLKRPRKGFRIGGNYNVRVMEQGYFKTGIRYVRQGYQQLDLLLSSPNIYKEFIDEYYIEFPLSFRYEFTENKFSFYTEAGISPHLFLKGKFIQQSEMLTTSNDYEIPYMKDRNFRLAFTVGVGLNYRISKRFQLFAQYSYRNFFPSDARADEIDYSLNAGFEMGIRYGINLMKNKN